MSDQLLQLSGRGLLMSGPLFPAKIIFAPVCAKKKYGVPARTTTRATYTKWWPSVNFPLRFPAKTFVLPVKICWFSCQVNTLSRPIRHRNFNVMDRQKARYKRVQNHPKSISMRKDLSIAPLLPVEPRFKSEIAPQASFYPSNEYLAQKLYANRRPSFIYTYIYTGTKQVISKIIGPSTINNPTAEDYQKCCTAVDTGVLQVRST